MNQKIANKCGEKRKRGDLKTGETQSGQLYNKMQNDQHDNKIKK